MGKASRWLRNLFKKQKHSPQPSYLYSDHHPQNDKTRWSFVKSSTTTNHTRDNTIPQNDVASVTVNPDEHAIAIAAATAAVAEAAVAAAKATAAVVKLTSRGRCDWSSYYGGLRYRWAAVVIQSAFRGYLARRALKALKSLVRLQALVRGHIVRKQTAHQVQKMQALLRVQARARAGRARLSESSQSSSRSRHHYPHDPLTPEKSEEVRSRSPHRNRASALKGNSSKMESRGSIGHVRPVQGTNWPNTNANDRAWDPLMKTCTPNDQISNKILEVDPGKPYSRYNQKNLFQASRHKWGLESRSHSLTTSKEFTMRQAAPSSASFEALPLTPINFSCELEDASFYTAENSPRFYSAGSVGGGSSRGGPFTPTKSDSLHSYLSGYLDYPNYMSFTKSSKAKLRSMSAPKQRPEYERSGWTKRHSYHSVSDMKSGAQRLSSLHSSFTNRAYPGSGRLDKLGMPVIKGDQYSYPYLYGQI